MLNRRRWIAACVAAAAPIAIAGCSASGSSASGVSAASAAVNSSASGSAGGAFSVTAGVLHAFTGQNAFLGLNAQNACLAAASQVNAAGGIMGHRLVCANSGPGAGQGPRAQHRRRPAL